MLEPIDQDLEQRREHFDAVFAEIDRILGGEPFLPEGRPEQPPMPPPRKIFKE